MGPMLLGAAHAPYAVEFLVARAARLPEAAVPPANGLALLMAQSQARGRADHLPELLDKDSMNGLDRLFNALVDWARVRGGGWTLDEARGRGRALILDLGKIIFKLTPHKAELYTQHVPADCKPGIWFQQFCGFEAGGSHKKKVPLTQELCGTVNSELVGFLAEYKFGPLRPQRWRFLADNVEELSCVMERRGEHLGGAAAALRLRRQERATVRDDLFNGGRLEYVPGLLAGVEVEAKYARLDDVVAGAALYRPVPLVDFLPTDNDFLSMARNRFVSGLELRRPVFLVVWKPAGPNEAQYWVMKVPQEEVRNFDFLGKSAQSRC